MGRRPKITFKVKDCRTCSNKAGCFLCLNKSEYEEELDIRKELSGKPSERDMERALKLIKKDCGKK